MHNIRNMIYSALHNRELNELYLSISIRAFAVSMIGIFVPIYLLQIGYNLSEVFLFFAVLFAAEFFLVIPAAKITSKFGIKHAMLFSIPFYIVYLFLLYLLPITNIPIYLIATLEGISAILHWTAYHLDLAKFSKKKERSKQVSYAIFGVRLFRTLGPLTGGLLILYFGFNITFIIVSLLLLASILPLFASKEFHESFYFSFKNTFNKKYFKESLGFIGFGLEHAISMVVWPTYLFFNLLNDFSLVGLVTSFSIFFALISALIVGKFANIKRHLTLDLGAFATTIIWVARLFVKTPFQIFFVDATYGAAETVVTIPFDSLTYDKEKKSKILQFIVLRQLAVHGSRAVLFLFLAFIPNFQIAFIIAASASILYLFF